MDGETGMERNSSRHTIASHTTIIPLGNNTNKYIDFSTIIIIVTIAITTTVMI